MDLRGKSEAHEEKLLESLIDTFKKKCMREVPGALAHHGGSQKTLAEETVRGERREEMPRWQSWAY